jgi:DNA-binding response OmpR family regulator
MAQLSAVEKKSNILVVDDEPMVCRSLEKILRRRGCEVAQALNVPAALDRLEAAGHFDLIIADLMMPQVGGLELLKIARERWPSTPVLIITGYASIASAVEATQYGAGGYLPKPFTPEELERAVDAVLAGEKSLPKNAKQEALAAGQIDVDLPFDRREVAAATSPAFVEHLTRSDLPIVEQKQAPVADYCSLGARACKRLAKQGMCKQPECPIVAGERRKAAKAGRVVPIVPDPIDVDMPFSLTEVASMTSEAYALSLGSSDMPNLGYWRSEKKAPAAPRVLVVDDEPVVVNSIRKTLARKSYKVEEAFSGREAMERIMADNFDLVLLDMRLPDANGLDLLAEMKKRRPELRVVIVTGYASIDTAVEAIRRGANDYMPKPFTPDELSSMTNKVLGRVA